jgi:serine/threonine-protein kinase
MSLQAGEKLGPYEIVAPIGAGGMGEVYRAHDTKLDRDVAIKVLPTALADDPERLARFEREAKVLAALNHPNIAQIYGVEDRALIMELVDGASPKGPMSFDDAWKIASQIASALEYAHERGIVHRDLKPDNIRVTADGEVKLLDFGLAKAFTEQKESSPNPEHSPTLTIGATEVGVILGTAAYMAPEQAKGKTVDKRADIWAFGVVLYELITGDRLFKGEDVSETLVSVLRDEPDVTKVPYKVRRLLRRCLEKDPKQRLRDIGDARELLESTATPAVRTTSKWPWIAISVLASISASLAVVLWQATQPADRPLVRLSVDLGPEAEARGVILSPDGSRIAYVGIGPKDQEQLFTRRLDQRESVPLSGTLFGSVEFPFFSPDGQWIGFFATGKVRKVAAGGGSAIALGDAPTPVYGGSWADDGNVFVGSGNGLKRIPAAGGALETVDGTEGIVAFPQALPGERAVLFNTNALTRSNGTDAGIEVLRFDTGKPKPLPGSGLMPLYLPSSGKAGHLVYVHDGTLFGVTFDRRRLETRGTPTPVLDDVNTAASVSGSVLAFSKTGTLVYFSGPTSASEYSSVDGCVGQDRSVDHPAGRVSPSSLLAGWQASSLCPGKRQRC